MSKQITKSYLEYLGVKEVTEDGRVFTNSGELKPYSKVSQGNRLTIKLHDSEKYKAIPKEKRNNSSGLVELLIHQVVYAWFNNEVPYGEQIHHIDGNYLNNAIGNLEALTPKEHRAKHASIRELKCRLDIPRSWYQKQLDELEALDKKTKANYDKICNYRAKLRYYDSHIEEAVELVEFKKDLMELIAWKQIFKENNNKKLWHESCAIEKMVREKGIEAKPIVTHALDVLHNTFGRKIDNEAI